MSQPPFCTLPSTSLPAKNFTLVEVPIVPLVIVTATAQLPSSASVTPVTVPRVPLLLNLAILPADSIRSRSGNSVLLM